MKTTLKYTAIILLWAGILGITQSCKKETFSPPEVLTMIASEVTESTAKTGGVIGDDGGTEVNFRGVCWSTSPDPTTSSDRTNDGSGSGLFSSVITGLISNTTYYFRAYAINNEGTSYGDQLEFTTSMHSSGLQKSNFPGDERSDAVSFAIGTKVYLGLGSSAFNNDYGGMRDFWEWDQTTNIWTKQAEFPGNSLIGAVGFSIGAKGYIGTGYSFTGEGYTNEFWEYDPATNTWSEKAPLPGSIARAYASGFSIGTKGYIGTGMYDDGWESYYFNDFWEWDQATNIWTRKADIGGVGRSSAVGFSIGTKGYIGTGYDFNNGFCRDFWEWDQETDRWTKKADLEGSARTSAVGFSIGTRGFIGTGISSDGISISYSRDFWEWNQATNIWIRKADLAGNGRYSAIGVSTGDKGYIGTGFNGDAEYYFRDFWEYVPE